MDSLIFKAFNGFGLFSQGNAFQVAVPGMLLGVLFHITIPQMVVIEYYANPTFAGFALAVCGLGSAYSVIGFSTLEIVTRIFMLVLFFNIGLFSSMVTYRLFFHRLRRFPGPVDLSISRFFLVRRVAKYMKYYREIAKLHDEYGDFIRTGPRELCIIRKSAVPTIYGINTKCLKSTWYGQNNSDSKKSSVIGSRDFDDHRHRRRAWDRGVSTKALQSYEPRIEALVDKLVSQISHRNGLVDGTAWSTYITFDIMGEVGLGEDFGCVSNGEEHGALKDLHSHMYILGILNLIPWLLNAAARLPSSTSGHGSFFSYCYTAVKERLENFDSEKTPHNILSWLLKAIIDKDISAPPTKDALNEDSRSLVVAGSDTSSSTLAAALFFLAKSPSVQKKLQAQIDALVPTSASWDYGKVKPITYIDNIIDETLRLRPSIMSGIYRVTPPEGIQIDEEFIPGDINVFVPTLRIQTDPRYWKQATEFIPERFGERFEEMETQGAPYMPFGSGIYTCAGKNLAVLSLRIIISKLVQQFDISLAPGETGEKFKNETLDTFTSTCTPLMLQFSPRK
ncbi:putative benzoate 4-monooxygenase cytochrome P450 [Hypoxylon trugodes]|uniref:putative benzoate 4-monooxygenase cytochrome P450 n=1 Tax=Hypoxylon trugodes TaxID=326681 RepID=UPI00218C9193|nr:putative benzoate 4-monooxygenase cytochrome P450 [Hypoxylon trugodes]KAI1391672.1 putative benzoate 4-monooxygenase cytochrome P450 [Hypoxylon trugodes]